MKRLTPLSKKSERTPKFCLRLLDYVTGSECMECWHNEDADMYAEIHEYHTCIEICRRDFICSLSAIRKGKVDALQRRTKGHSRREEKKTLGQVDITGSRRLDREGKEGQLETYFHYHTNIYI